MNQMTRVILYKGKYWILIIPEVLVVGALVGASQYLLASIATAFTVVVAIWAFNKYDRPIVKSEVIE